MQDRPRSPRLKVAGFRADLHELLTDPTPPEIGPGCPAEPNPDRPPSPPSSGPRPGQDSRSSPHARKPHRPLLRVVGADVVRTAVAVDVGVPRVRGGL